MIRDPFGLVAGALANHADWAFRMKPDGKWRVRRRPRRPKSVAEVVNRLIEDTRSKPS